MKLLLPNGKTKELIKVGDPGDFFEGIGPLARCGDCGARYGQYHQHFICDCERCPICGGQMLSCDHADYPIYQPRHGKRWSV